MSDTAAVKLTIQQHVLLRDLPASTDAGKFCKGGELRTAERLVRLGLAQKVGVGVWAGGYYVRTAHGEKKLEVIREQWLDQMKGCRANCDGDCDWRGCPQLRDGEPKRSGRHCPLDLREED